MQTSTRTRARFRYESDLIEPLRPSLAPLMYSSGSLPEVVTFAEVPAVHGVPDLTAIRFDWEAIRTRTEAGVRPLATEVEVAAVLALKRRRLTTAELADSIRCSHDYARRAVVPLLIERGWARPAAEKFEVPAEARTVGVRVVTVEAKLRDWHRALGQARRQRFSADSAFIALDAASVPPAAEELRYIAENGIGVVSVDSASGQARIWAHPKGGLSRGQTEVGRMLIAERCLDLWLRGELDGQVYPVFGWTRP